MGLWFPFGFAKRADQAAATSAFGRYQHWVESRSPTLKEWPSSIGRTTVPDSRTTRLDQETHCSYQTASADRKTSSFLPRRPGSTVTFRCGHRTRHSFTSFRVRSQINWTSGEFVQTAELPNGSRRTMGA